MAVPDLFPDSLPASCGALTPSGCVHAANPSPLPAIRPPKPKPQLPAPARPGGWADKPLGLVSTGRHRSSVRESLHFGLRSPVAALSSVAPKLPPSATHSLHPQRGFLVCGNLSSLTAPSQWCRSCPYSFVFVFSFFFCPTQVRGEFLAFWEVWGLLPAFSRYSIGAVPHVDVFLMYLSRGRWPLRLTLPPSWSSLIFLFFNVGIITINFPFSTSLASSYMFWYVVFSFSFISTYFWFPFWSSLTHWFFRRVLFNLHIFVNFPVFLIYLFLVSYHVVRKDTWYVFNLFKFAKTCFVTTSDLSWRMFHVHLRRMCVMLIVDGMFCICLLGSFGLKYSSSLMFPDWLSIWVIYPLSKLVYWSPYCYHTVVYYSLQIC